MKRTLEALPEFFRRTLPVIVLLVAIGLAVLMHWLRPSPDEEPPLEQYPAVETLEVEAVPVTLKVRTQGTVRARTETVLTAEVSGLIEWVSPRFEDGGFFEKGEEFLRIESLEYASHLAEARSRLAQAQLVWEQEQAQSEQARQDWESIGRGEPTALVLRQPQLARAQAEVAAAEAQIRMARRNLDATQIRAPYDGRILRKEVDVGQAVMARSTPLAHLYSVEVAEVRLPITSEDYGHIELREDYRGEAKGGSRPTVILSAELGGVRYQWEGVIARTEGVVDSRSRLTYVVARVDNPYARRGDAERSSPPLKVGQFVEAEIEGRRLKSAFEIPRGAVHAGNLVYVVNAQNRLHSRKVAIARMDAGSAVITDGLQTGDRVCLTPLLFFVEGMRVEPEPTSPTSGASGNNATREGGE